MQRAHDTRRWIDRATARKIHAISARAVFGVQLVPACIHVMIDDAETSSAFRLRRSSPSRVSRRAAQKRNIRMLNEDVT